jgi:hypothetical protein
VRPMNHCVRRALLNLTLIAVSGGFCCARTQTDAPVPIPQRPALQAVASALHLDTSDLENSLQLLRSPFLLPGNAHLRVVSIKAAGGNSWFLRVECDSRRDCLPFYALLRSSVFNATVLPRSGSKPDRQLEADIKGLTRQSRSAPIERSGDRVEVVEELSGMHFRTRAICLQSGSLGDLIRVRNLSTHRVVLATVAGDRVVRVER